MQVRAEWANGLWKADWAQPYRARIHLRNTLGREPTREEVERAEGNFKHISQEQILAALDTGVEVCSSAFSC